MKIKKVIFYIVIGLSCLLILASLLSLVYDIPKWYLKILDFPRLQQIFLAVILLIAVILLKKAWSIKVIGVSVGLLVAIGIHFSYLAPYLLGEKAVPDISAKQNKNSVGILIANVLITNQESQQFLEIIQETDPDIILAMEVNAWWINELSSLKEEYPYFMEYPEDNAYGMALYSRFPLKNEQTLFLNHSRVPSMHAEVTLLSGKIFKLHAVHPVAPFPSSKYPENIGSGNDHQEVAITKVGKMVSEYQMPSIVAGDFNDVAWSNTSRLFGQNGNLKDVRIGRGLLNTFNAHSFFMRWPLDHFFVSEDIAVAEFKRLPKFNSDHFPLYARLVIE